MKKKVIVLISILFVVIITFFIYSKCIYINNVPVLAYHDVVNNPKNETDISINNFEKQMKYLYDHNYTTLSLDEYYEWKKGKKIKGKKILLTFDDGDESFYKVVIPILEKYNFKAVNFVIQNSIDQKGYLTNTQINNIKNNKNFDIQSHSFNLHIDTLATSNNFDIYNDDMKINKKYNYKYYAYPYGISNENYIKALKQNEYKLAFKYSPSKWSNKNQNDFLITRVPIYKNNSLLKFIIKISIKY